MQSTSHCDEATFKVNISFPLFLPPNKYPKTLTLLEGGGELPFWNMEDLKLENVIENNSDKM